MTTNTKDAQIIHDLVKEKKVELLTPNGFNWNPLVAKSEKYITDGVIGTIKHIDASFSSSCALIVSSY